MTDPVADMINRIRNAQAVFSPSVLVPFSNFKYQIAKVLEKEGYVKKTEKKGRKFDKVIKIDLKYLKDPSSAKPAPFINGLKKTSKPGQRIYASANEMKTTKGRLSQIIVTTPQGIVTGREARKKNIGGEIILEIW
jgi:small subunit ribosomal protein S8